MDPLSPRKQVRSVDGFMATRPGQQAPPVRRPHATQPAPQPTTPPLRPYAAKQAHQQQPQPEKRPSFMRRLLATVGKFMLAMGIFVGTFLIQTPAFGQLAIAVYALVALGFRISSRITFTMAVAALGLVILASVRSDVTLANTFALYVFLLLIVGTLTLWREVRSEI